MRYAILDDNNIVTNVAVSEYPLKDSWVLGESANIGDTYNPETGEFTPPEIDEEIDE